MFLFQNKTDTIKKFVLLCHPRSGSSFFAGDVLSRHPEIHCYDELFNNTQNTLTFLKKIGHRPFYKGNTFAMNRFLDKFYKKTAETFNKKAIGFELFPFQLTDSLSDALLKKQKYFFIYLERKNILQAAVSYEIANKTGQWNIRQRKEFNSFEADIEELEKFILDYRQGMQRFKKILEKNSQKFITIFYENLFTQDTLDSVCEFLSITKIPNFQFRDTKLNNQSRYNLISNIQEVEKLLGSPENGYLFK
jgi:hypothetical protein